MINHRYIGWTFIAKITLLHILENFANIEIPKRDDIPFRVFNRFTSYVKCFKEEMQCLLFLNPPEYKGLSMNLGGMNLQHSLHG